MFAETLQRQWYRWWPSHLLGEVLAKRWTETAVPFFVLLAVLWGLASAIPGLLDVVSLSDMARQYGEIGLIVLGLALVMIGGGVDISLGSTFAVANFAALSAVHLASWPAWAGVTVGVVVGALLGAVNGVLVGYLRLRAFLTTLITLIVYRAFYDLLILRFGTAISGVVPESVAWEYLGSGDFLGFPVSFWVLILFALVGHITLTRLRYGWHVAAIGGGRRAAHNAGLPVRATVASTYVIAGALTGLAASFFGARLASVGADIGIGMEIMVLTAAVLGGISLGGGKGSVAMALIGTAIVLLLTNGLIRLGASGGTTRIVLASILLLAVIIDVRWNKNRQRVVSKVYLSPTYFALSAPPRVEGAYEENSELKGIHAIGVGEVEGPEDVILDEDDNLYCGTRHGEIVRFFAPDYKRREVFARIGGHPLGMAFDREGRLYVCVGGMGLYYVEKNGSVHKATDETNRHWLSVTDDSRLRLADDLDIAPDGRIFFSEATTRYEMHDWAQDSLEARGNGRIICYDPKTKTTKTVLRGLVFPNGICVAQDGHSIFFAETWACRIRRWWFDGPRKGELITVVDSLPGYPDNINRASDGSYWVALIGMRTPSFDLALRMPGFRKRMAKRLPLDEWMFPNINTGCVLKFKEDGTIVKSLWDPEGHDHPSVTSMREHKGYLYLGGLLNNRIGRYTLPDADKSFTQPGSYWKKWGPWHV